MAQKKRYNIGGREIMGEEIEFETEKESWNVYILHDGTKMKLKSVPAAFIRTDEYNPATGDPIYVVNGQQIAVADVPEQLKKKQ